MKKHLMAVLLVGLFAAGLWAQEAPAPLETTKGLKYEAIKKGAEYAVSLGAVSIGSDEKNFTLVIPSTYKGKPVTAVAAKGFESAMEQTNQYNRELKVVLPNTITVIGESAFARCAIKALEVPASVKEIGPKAFDNCNLKSLTLNEGLVTIGAEAFAYNWLNGDITFPKTLTKIGDAAFFGNGMSDQDSGLRNLVFNSDSVVIGDVAFARCNRLTSVTFAGKVTDIGLGAFALTSLESLTIPEGLTKLRFATVIASSLTKIVLPSTLKEISSVAFPAVYPVTVEINAKAPPKVVAPAATDPTTLYDKSFETIGNFGDLTRFKVIATKNLKSITVPKGTEAAYGDSAGWGDYADWLQAAE